VTGDADVDIASRLFTKQSCVPYWNGPRQFHINRNIDTYNRQHSIWQRLQWLPRRASESMPMRKKRCPRRRQRSDGRVATTMVMTATTPSPHRRRRSLLRRNSPGDPAPTMVTKPTQRTTTTTMGATTTTMTTMTGATMTAIVLRRCLRLVN
jgi:hypothetical protein